jgi:hypothetical protein
MFYLIGFAGIIRDSLVLCSRSPACVGVVGHSLHEASYLVHCNPQVPDNHLTQGSPGTHLEMLRQCRKASHNKIHEPGNSDVTLTGNTMEGDFLQP